MLFCTSLLAYVGAGEQPALTPRRLGVLNTSTGGGIQDLHFAASVLAVRLKPLLRRHGCNAAADALLQIIARARGHPPYIFSMLVDGPAVLGVPREWQAV